METAARAVGQRLHARARGRIDGRLLRCKREQFRRVGRRERERVDGHAEPVGQVEHGAQRGALVGLDVGDGLIAGLGVGRGRAVELALLCVEPVGEDDDGLAPLTLLRQFRERVAQSLVEVRVAAAVGLFDGEGSLAVVGGEALERLDLVAEDDDLDTIFGAERVEESYRRLLERRPEVPRRARHVEQQHEAEGRRRRLEADDRLFDAVLEDVEVGLRQIDDGASLGVCDADVEDDEVRVDRLDWVFRCLRAHGGRKAEECDEGADYFA